MPSLEERFRRLLSIKAEILKLVAEAETLLPHGGELVLSEVEEELPPAQSRSQSHSTAVSETIPAPANTPSTALSPAKVGDEEIHTAYNPRPDGPLKGKSLPLAVEQVMKENFSQVSGVNRQIMAILAEQGFDGFPAHSLEDPMDLVRNILSNHPNIERPSRKTYLWVAKASNPEDAEEQNPEPRLSALLTTQRKPEPTDHITSQGAEHQQPELGGEDVTFLQLVTHPPTGGDSRDNGDEDL